LEGDHSFESQIAAPPAVGSCHHPVSGVQTTLTNLHGIT